jgi:acyl-CoA thioesterase
MSTHVFDEAIALERQANGHWLGYTSPGYANMMGPYGGISAAQLLNAVLLHPERLGDPVALTVNFAAAVADGAFEIQARAARTNRSTQHWMIEMVQDGQTVLTATAMTAVRRETWGQNEVPMPELPAPMQVERAAVRAPMEFVQRYEQRYLVGGLPQAWDGSGEHSLTQLWVRDTPPRALDYASLAAVADVFIPRVFVRRATRVPTGTVSMTVYFHATTAQLAETGSGFLLGQARAQAYRDGYFDQTAQLWNEAGTLMATSHQIVYYKE